MLPGEIHHTRYFGLRDLKCIDPTFADTMIVNVEHDFCRLFSILTEKSFQNVNDKLHRCVVIVENQHAIEAWLLGFCMSARDDSRTTAAIPAVGIVVSIFLHCCAAIDQLVNYLRHDMPVLSCSRVLNVLRVPM